MIDQADNLGGAGDDNGWPKRLGRFEVRRELGRGGCGVVFLAYDPRLGREIALKVPHLPKLISPRSRRRFLREARYSGMLDHANVISVFESGEINGICYIASAYCPGPTLRQWLKQREQPIPIRLAAELALSLTSALEHAHSRGILHRDLKPSNVMLHPDDHDAAIGPPGPEQFAFIPKVTDFGLARYSPEGDQIDEELTASGAILGTASYMAPEQASAQQALVGTTTDVYALGAILYELLTGTRPFPGDDFVQTLERIRRELPAPIRAHRPEVTRDLEAICMKCLEKDPANRYASAAAFGEDLTRFLNGEVTAARPIAKHQRYARLVRRHPAVATLSLIALTAIAVLVAGLIVYSHNLNSLNKQLDRANGRLREVAAASRTAERRAQASEDNSKRMLFAAELRLAFDAWRHHNYHEYERLLDRHRSPSEQRSIAWQCLNRLGRNIVPVWEQQHTDESLYTVEFSHDGTLLATAGMQSNLRILDARNHEHVGSIPTGQTEINGICFSIDDQRILTAGDNGEVCIWDLQSQDLLRRFDAKVGKAFNALLSPSQQRIAVCGTEPVIRLFDAATADLVHTLEGHSSHVEMIAYSPDGKRLASAGNDHSVKLWDATNGTLL